MLNKLAKALDFKNLERKIVIFFTIGLIFYIGLVLFADIKKIFRVSLAFNWWLVLVLLILSFLNYLVRFVRWHYFLAKISIDLPSSTSFQIFLSGLSMTVTPGKMGEVVKAYLVKKHTGNKFAQMIPLLITERLTDGIGMLILALGGIYLFRQSILFFAFSLGIVVIFFCFVYYKAYTLRIIRKLEEKIGHLKALDFFLTFFDHSDKLLKPKQLAVAIILSCLAWSLEGFSLFLLISSFGQFWNLNSLLFAFFIFSFSSIAGFLVLLPGGIGVAEGSITSLLTLFYKLDLTSAIFITLIFRFTTLWFGVFLGMISLFASLSKLSLTRQKT